MNDAQKQQIKDATDWAREQRDWAAGRVRDFDRGEKLFRGTGDGPNEDVTQKHREDYERTVVQMDKLIAAYGALNP